MDSAGRIAWIGALAVALGVVGAAGAPPAISWAEASDSASGTASEGADSSPPSPCDDSPASHDTSPTDRDHTSGDEETTDSTPDRDLDSAAEDFADHNADLPGDGIVSDDLLASAVNEPEDSHTGDEVIDVPAPAEPDAELSAPLPASSASAGSGLEATGSGDLNRNPTVGPTVTAARNWFARTFFAATPVLPDQTASIIVDPVTVSDPFTITASDADGRALTYDVHGSGTASGTLTISSDSATYTPPAAWDGVTAYTDTFTVSASDDQDGFHIHGLSGLLYSLTFGLLGRAGHTATATVTVDVRATPTPPGPGPDPDPPTPPNGPGLPGSFPVSFSNNSGYADDEVYVMVIGQVTPGQWSWVDRDGVAHHIDHKAADAAGHLEKDGVKYADMTFTLAEADGLRIPPRLLGGRIYVSLKNPLYIGISADNSGWASPDGANPDDPNYDTVYDWYELSYQNGAVPFGGNTTQVDQFGFPFTFTVSQDSTRFSATRGMTSGRDDVFRAFEDTVPKAFQALIISGEDGHPIRILSPRSHQPGDLATWFDGPVDDFWRTYRTKEFVYHGPGYTVTGRVAADSHFAYSVTANGGAATTHIMAKPTTGDIFRADGPFVGTGLQGAFLAELDAAFNRGVATSPDHWNEVSAYYPAGGRWNDWARFFHAHSVGGYAYGFPYDDVNSQSSVVILGDAEPLTNLMLTLSS